MGEKELLCLVDKLCKKIWQERIEGMLLIMQSSLQTVTNRRGTATTLTYDAFGNPRTSKTASHTVINYTYDAIGRMTGLADQVGSSTSFFYDKELLKLGSSLLLALGRFKNNIGGSIGDSN